MKSPKQVVKVLICVLALLSCSTSCRAKDMKEPGSKELGSVDGAVITEEQVRSRNAGELESLELEFLKAKAVFARDEHKVLSDGLENIIREKLARNCSSWKCNKRSRSLPLKRSTHSMRIIFKESICPKRMPLLASGII